MFCIKKFLPLFIGVSLYAQTEALPSRTEKEELFLRRIVELWENKEKAVVGKEIEKFFQENPEANSFSLYLHGFLGDVYLEEKKYEEALSQYALITQPEIKDKVFSNVLHSLFSLKKFESLEKEATFYLQGKDINDKKLDYVRFFLADSYYQRALLSVKMEEKTDLLQKARSGFSSILASEYAKPSLQTLALIAKELHEEKGAAAIYEELATKYPEEKEDFLFQSALAKETFDKESAIQTFGQIFHGGKKKVWEAGYNRLLLLFETERYSEVILAKDQIFSMIPESKVPFLFFVAGKSYFSLGDYRRAAGDLKKYVNKEEGKSPEKEHALSLLLSCANTLEDKDLFDEALQYTLTLYPQSPEITKALFARGLLAKKKENFAGALHDFQEVEKMGIASSDKESFLFEFAHLKFQTKDWTSAHERFVSFTKEFPHHVQIPLAWNYLIQTSIELAKQENTPASKKNLALDLQAFLEKASFASEGEKQEYRFILARTLYETQEIAQAVAILQTLHDIPSFPHAAEVSLLLALSSREEKKEEKVFCQYMQEALSLDAAKKLPTGAIHLALFNSYLMQSVFQKELIDKSAEHLYCAQKEISNILSDNLLWLAHYYFQRVKDAEERDFFVQLDPHDPLFLSASRGIEILEKLCLLYAKDYKLDEKNLFMEASFLYLSYLYGVVGQYDKKTALLEHLVLQYKNTQIPWKHEDVALLELGRWYESKNEKEKALSSFEILSAKNKKNHFVLEASLRSTCLRLDLMKPEEFQILNPVLLREIDTLKNMKIVRKLTSEPVHLEAALEYVDIQSRLENTEKALEKRISLLSKMKEEFYAEEDILSKDYHQSRKLFPSKDRLFQAYMRMVDAEIAMNRFFSTNSSEKENYRKEASRLFQSIVNDKLIVNVYVKNRIEKDLKLLESKE